MSVGIIEVHRDLIYKYLECIWGDTVRVGGVGCLCFGSVWLFSCVTINFPLKLCVLRMCIFFGRDLPVCVTLLSVRSEARRHMVLFLYVIFCFECEWSESLLLLLVVLTHATCAVYTSCPQALALNVARQCYACTTINLQRRHWNVSAPLWSLMAL